MKQAAVWSLFWVSCALLFNIGIWIYSGQEKALEFLAGYLIEKSLSIDNLFVFLLIFKSFDISTAEQRRILMYGVVGAVVLRIVMILFGVWLVKEFHWILYVFGAFLIVTALKMYLDLGKPPQPPQILILLQKYFRLTKPFWIVVLIIEFSDIIFAVDSIPAVFAITTDPFIVITSNLFAIMGLRSLYFLLAEMADRFYLLKYGLIFILFFVGMKMLIVPWVTISTPISLAIIATTLVVCVTWRKNIQPGH